MQHPLPVVEPALAAARPARRRLLIGRLVQLLRVLMIVGILWGLHVHAAATRTRVEQGGVWVSSKLVAALFDEPVTEAVFVPDGQAVVISNTDGAQVGTVRTTARSAPGQIGFSGPSVAVIGFDRAGRCSKTALLSSQDTRNHVASVTAHHAFWTQFRGLAAGEIARRTDFDLVTGATLTSSAIVEGLRAELGGKRSVALLPPWPSEDMLSIVVPDFKALRIEADGKAWVDRTGDLPALAVLATSESAVNILGYQGPTAAYLLWDEQQGSVQQFVVGTSFDNEPYVSYLQEDWQYPRWFAGHSLADIAAMSDDHPAFEGVSGATMTSQAVTQGVVQTCRQRVLSQSSPSDDTRPLRFASAADVCVFACLLLAMLVQWTRLRTSRVAQWLARLAALFGLGLYAGTLLSLTQLAGWTAAGPPQAVGLGLVVLTTFAVLAPVASKSNLYCHHLCPHGAAQQLLLRRALWQWTPGRTVARVLRLVPFVILLAAIIVLQGDIPAALVDWEPFDAYAWRSAGIASIALAVISLLWSSITPMAYCRYGCALGTILDYPRWNSRAAERTPADVAALVLLLLTWAGNIPLLF